MDVFDVPGGGRLEGESPLASGASVSLLSRVNRDVALEEPAVGKRFGAKLAAELMLLLLLLLLRMLLLLLLLLRRLIAIYVVDIDGRRRLLLLLRQNLRK